MLKTGGFGENSWIEGIKLPEKGHATAQKGATLKSLQTG